MSDNLRYGVTIGFGLIAIALAVAASLVNPILTFDKVVVGALLIGGLAAGGVAVNLTPNSVKAMREGHVPAPYPMTPPPMMASGSPKGPSWLEFDALDRRITAIENDHLFHEKQAGSGVDAGPTTGDGNGASATEPATPTAPPAKADIDGPTVKLPPVKPVDKSGIDF